MKKVKEFLKLNNEDIVIISLAAMSFSFGIWVNYRQLWLQSIGFDIQSISKILSVSLICSSIIIFFISFFSTKINLKNLILLSTILRAISIVFLALTNISIIIKASMLLCIMCENIYGVAFYPFLSTINKSNETYKKHVLVSYFSKDIAVIFCGLMLGVTLGKVAFDYNTCLFLSLIFTLISGIILLLYEEDKVTKKRNVLPLKKAFKNLIKNKNINFYLIGQFISEVGYSIVFGMMMLLLTNFLGFNVSVASIFIIVCNLLGSITCSLLNKVSGKWSSKLCTFIKYSSRSFMYILAYLSGSVTMFIIAIIVAYISTRILDDKVNGVYIRKIRTDSQFLFGNIRYFVLCIADGLGIFIAGILLDISISLLFLTSAIITIISMLVYMFLCKE